jgi:hypothetical protein
MKTRTGLKKRKNNIRVGCSPKGKHLRDVLAFLDNLQYINYQSSDDQKFLSDGYATDTQQTKVGDNCDMELNYKDFESADKII